MSPTPGDPRVTEEIAEIPPELIASLARLYDHFANAFDPDAPGLDSAEKAFNQTVAGAYDFVMGSLPEGQTRISLRDFRRGIIRRCKLHLKATEKPPTLGA